ncbi:lysozyme [Spirosoma agri]|uniref:Lysozyme n=1 Tax=Spirosoma agri TaxID=1987381 RepID=A0A6M0INL3_9BACT|nr:lysozyme [Spirosoma agri]NEU69664.1 lysozyme [Spirosoma agri]
MHTSVNQSFRAFNEPFEGVVPYMYLDILGLVTVGVGNLIDPISAALSLPFQYKNKPGITTPGAPAATNVIEAEWKLLKGKQELAKLHHRACAKLTNLELSEDAINKLIQKRLQQNESFLKRQIPFQNFDNWPADAQLAILSMAWAMGPGNLHKWTLFAGGCKRMDFDTAAENCRMREAGNPGVIPRNKANKHLFQNAAAVLAGEADGFYQISTLYYPVWAMKPIVF